MFSTFAANPRRFTCTANILTAHTLPVHWSAQIPDSFQILHSYLSWLVWKMRTLKAHESCTTQCCSVGNKTRLHHHFNTHESRTDEPLSLQANCGNKRHGCTFAAVTCKEEALECKHKHYARTTSTRSTLAAVTYKHEARKCKHKHYDRAMSAHS